MAAPMLWNSLSTIYSNCCVGHYYTTSVSSFHSKLKTHFFHACSGVSLYLGSHGGGVLWLLIISQGQPCFPIFHYVQTYLFGNEGMAQSQCHHYTPLTSSELSFLVRISSFLPNDIKDWSIGWFIYLHFAPSQIALEVRYIKIYHIVRILLL